MTRELLLFCIAAILALMVAVQFRAFSKMIIEDLDGNAQKTARLWFALVVCLGVVVTILVGGAAR